MPDTESKTEAQAAPHPITFRLAAHPDSPAHSYEIGRPGADLTDSSAFEIMARAPDAARAAAVAQSLNANPSAAKANEEDDEHIKHKRASHTR